jgi:hypothetical protein
MRDFGYVRNARAPLGAQAPEPADDETVAVLACGPLRGEWCTVVQVHFFVEGIALPELGLALSEKLGTHVLSLNLEDGDVLYFHLHYRGELLDSYTSDPMYFEKEPIPDSEVEKLRHHPEAFTSLLPPGASLEEVSTLLARGWWHAHDQGELEEDGTMTEAAYMSDEYLDAENRMARFATLLQLHGSTSDYPYVAWGEAGAEAWSGFTLVTYARA